MHEPSPQHISLFGSDVHYWTFHDDKPLTIVALHGFRGTHHGLLKIVAALPEYRFIVPDLPGFGASTPMTERRHDIEGYRDFTLSFMQHVAPQKPILLGHSLGTIIAAAAIAVRPSLCTKVILINPIAIDQPNRFDPALAIGRFYYWFGGRALPEQSGLAVLKSKAVIRLGSALMTKSKDRAMRRAIHQSHIEQFGSFQTRAVLNESYAASIAHTVTEFAAHITQPVLLIAGEKDAMAPVAGAYQLEAVLSDSRLTVVPDIGHLIHHEGVDIASRAISTFLRA